MLNQSLFNKKKMDWKMKNRLKWGKAKCQKGQEPLQHTHTHKFLWNCHAPSHMMAPVQAVLSQLQVEF